ncbi:hypothetical protein D3C87_1299960 [compost metagenome]
MLGLIGKDRQLEICREVWGSVFDRAVNTDVHEAYFVFMVGVKADDALFYKAIGVGFNPQTIAV